MTDAITNQAEVTYKNEYLDANNPYPGETLLKTLDFCFTADIPIPQWARDEYRKCFNKYHKRISDTPLVTAFNTDQEAGKHRPSKLKKEKYLNTVYHLFMYFYTTKNRPIDGNLFDEIAEIMSVENLSGTTIKNWYYLDIRPMHKGGVVLPYNMQFIEKYLKK